MLRALRSSNLALFDSGFVSPPMKYVVVGSPDRAGSFAVPGPSDWVHCTHICQFANATTCIYVCMRMSCTPVGTKTRGWWGIILGLGHGPRTVHARRPGHRPPPHTDRSPQRRRARYPGAGHVPGRPDTPHHAGPRSYVRRRDQQRDTLLSGCARVR